MLHCMFQILPVIFVQTGKNEQGRVQLLMTKAVVLHANYDPSDWSWSPVFMWGTCPACYRDLSITVQSLCKIVTPKSFPVKTQNNLRHERQETAILLLQARRYLEVSVRFLKLQRGTDVPHLFWITSTALAKTHQEPLSSSGSWLPLSCIFMRLQIISSTSMDQQLLAKQLA